MRLMGCVEGGEFFIDKISEPFRMGMQRFKAGGQWGNLTYDWCPGRFFDLSSVVSQQGHEA